MALVRLPAAAHTVQLGHQLFLSQSILQSPFTGDRNVIRLGNPRWAGTARIVVSGQITDAVVRAMTLWATAMADAGNWTALNLGMPAPVDASRDDGFVHDGTRTYLRSGGVLTPGTPAANTLALSAATTINAYWRGGDDGFGPLLTRSPDWIEDFEFAWIERIG